MAIMYPGFGPKTNESTRAEPLVYSLLQEQLNDEFHVIHSIPWLSSVVDGFSDKCSGIGEIDFLVLHPTLGFLAIEVKGGTLHHDCSGFHYKKKGKKESVSFDSQLGRGRYALQSFLSKRGKKLKIGAAYFLCDSKVEPINLPPNLVDSHEDISLVFDIRDVKCIGERIERLMKYYGKVYQQESFSTSEIEHVIGYILPEADFAACWSSRIRNDEVLWLRLTEEQEECVNLALNSPRLLVSGWPGTGKTIVGIETARRLSETSKQVLFVAFNELLTKEIKYQLEHSDHCTVRSFHQLCIEAEQFLNKESKNKNQDWYKSESAQSLMAAIQLGFLNKFDVLIVDEAQIINPMWWDTLFQLFCKRRIVALCDEIQAFPYETKMSLSDLEELLEVSHFLLTKSLRVPKKVCNRLKTLVSPSYSVVNPRPIEEDTYHEIAVLDVDHQLAKLNEQFQRDSIRPGQVTFLIPYSNGQLEWLSNLGYRVETIGRFRGVESSIIVVVVNGEVTAETLYCAYSRCTSRCIVVFDACAIVKNDIKLTEISTSAKAREIYKEFLHRATFGFQISNPPLTLHQVIEENDLFSWCDQWGGYLLYSNSKENTDWYFWEDLVRECPSTLYTCNDKSNTYFNRFRPFNEDDLGCFYNPEIFQCVKCRCATPHQTKLFKKACLVCGYGYSERSFEFEQEINHWNAIMRVSISLSPEEKRDIPLPVAAYLALSTNGLLKNNVVIKCLVDAYGDKYKWVLCLLIAYIYQTGKQQEIVVVKELMIKLSRWNNELKSCSKSSLSGRVSSALERLDKVGVTKKTEKKGERAIILDSELFS
ncbi:AAA family ATPase [Ketobacter sp. MCCC 1A13808]|nr:AAA family ATPase [Ketobacter sp. MCCC 1A13808]